MIKRSTGSVVVSAIMFAMYLIGDESYHYVCAMVMAGTWLILKELEESK